VHGDLTVPVLLADTFEPDHASQDDADRCVGGCAAERLTGGSALVTRGLISIVPP
jgi:hypothetical protein